MIIANPKWKGIFYNHHLEVDTNTRRWKSKQSNQSQDKKKCNLN